MGRIVFDSQRALVNIKSYAPDSVDLTCVTDRSHLPFRWPCAVAISNVNRNHLRAAPQYGMSTYNPAGCNRHVAVCRYQNQRKRRRLSAARRHADIREKHCRWVLEIYPEGVSQVSYDYGNSIAIQGQSCLFKSAHIRTLRRLQNYSPVVERGEKDQLEDPLHPNPMYSGWS